MQRLGGSMLGLVDSLGMVFLNVAGISSISFRKQQHISSFGINRNPDQCLLESFGCCSNDPRHPLQVSQRIFWDTSRNRGGFSRDSCREPENCWGGAETKRHWGVCSGTFQACLIGTGRKWSACTRNVYCTYLHIYVCM